MAGCGTAGFADFREDGVEGVTALREAAAGCPVLPLIFGREGGEFVADGLGVSSARDVPGVESKVDTARKQGKKVAFHAGERDSGDIDAALSFDPDLLVHMTHATRAQLRECAERRIPIAVCPRSNWVLGVADGPGKPPIMQMLDLGCTVLLGTDNVMFVQPDLFAELSFTATVYRIPPADALRAAVEGASLAGRNFFIETGHSASAILFDPTRANLRFSKNPVESIVKRANSGTIEKNVFKTLLK
jgi:cytosine/adenosine deaminase-related metal-dependent hydrolase